MSAPLRLVPPAAEPLEPLLTAATVTQILGVRPKRVYELGIPAVRIDGGERLLELGRAGGGAVSAAASPTPRARASGRDRSLSADEPRALERCTPAPWWPLFAMLAYTGLCIGEAQSLEWGAVRLAERRLAIGRGQRRVKTDASVRDVPIPEPLAEPLAELLAAHRLAYQAGPADPVFPAPRYLPHAPESQFAQDAALLAESLSGKRDAERQAAAELLRAGIRPA